MKTGGLISAATSTERRFLSSSHGSMTIPGIFMFTVLIAVSGLAIDMQRVYGVHGEMQAFVDNVALAAAAELDGQSTAISRSFNAACGTPCSGTQDPLVTGPAGSARFATDTTLTIRKVTFLESIGNDPGPLAPTPAMGDVVLCTYEAPMFTPDCGMETPATASTTARFVEVVAADRDVQFLMLPIADVILGMAGAPPITDQATLRLRATAGFRRALCNNVPLMVCNPSELTNGKGSDFLYTKGQMILARMQGKGWDPPNFGLLNSFVGDDELKLRQALGLVNPGTFCTEDEVTVRTGMNTGPVQQGLNTRFDMWDGTMKPDPAYRPAPNVIRGADAKAIGKGVDPCSPFRDITVPLPWDNCFMTTPSGPGNCLLFGGEKRFGDGQWARAEYWTNNHGAEPQPPGYIVPVSPANPIGGMTRYQTYRYEIAKNPPMTGTAQIAPACYNESYPGSPPDLHPDRDRRLAYVAVVNCLGDAAALAAGKEVPVKAYAKVFLISPAGDDYKWGNGKANIAGTLQWPAIGPQDLPIEIADVVTPNDQSGHLHVYPVLYR